MKKETIEEVAERFWRNDETMSDYVQQAYITGFIAGSKWQQEQDREMEKEQMILFYLKGCDDTYGIDEPCPVEDYDRKEAEEYYNEIFKNETK